MRFQAFIVLFFILMFSCKAKDSTDAGLEEDLKHAMQIYLYNAVNNDSTHVKYRVQDIAYYDDKNNYICEFKVNMKTKLLDTTGTMKAYISKDFKKISRLY